MMGMMNNHDAQFIDSALELAPQAINLAFGENTILPDDKPTIWSGHFSYGSTAGPFGGIGGQAITSFQHVVVVYEFECVFIYIGRKRYATGRMTTEFQNILELQQNPWTNRNYLKKPDAIV